MQLRPCGTVAAYRRHLVAGETPCAPCLEATRVANTAYRRSKGIPEMQPARCGTRSGYAGHLRRKEPACQPCLRANRENAYHYQRGRARTQKTRPTSTP